MGTYLVTGGSGFFGQIMSRYMVGKGHTIVNIDLCDSEFKDEKFICFKGDIRDKELLEKIFSSYKFDAVFHFAAMLAHERKIATSRDGQFAAFDTGLLTPYAQRIFANFVANDSIVPWRLNGFSTHSNVQPVPEPATYVCELQHFMLMEPCTVRLGRTLRKQEAARIASDAGMTLEPQIEKSVVRARRSYRMVTPAYDPQAEEMRLLLPLALEVPNMVDQALVLEALDCAEEDAAHQGPRYEAKAILSLERARTCARAVSAELPSWLG